MAELEWWANSGNVANAFNGRHTFLHGEKSSKLHVSRGLFIHSIFNRMYCVCNYLTNVTLCKQLCRFIYLWNFINIVLIVFCNLHSVYVNMMIFITLFVIALPFAFVNNINALRIHSTSIYVLLYIAGLELPIFYG